MLYGPVPAVAVNVAVAKLPSQIEAGAVIVPAGRGFIVTAVTADVAEQPPALVVVTE